MPLIGRLVSKLQQDWIGRSTGAEVDFFIGDAANSAFDAWKASRAKSGFPATQTVDSLRVYTTRPDTLYGATYMVIAPSIHWFSANDCNATSRGRSVSRQGIVQKRS